MIAERFNSRFVPTKITPGAVLRAAQHAEAVLASDGAGGFCWPDFAVSFDAIFTIARVLEMLANASKRGVDIKLMIAGKHNDTWWARQNSVRLYGALITAGVEIHTIGFRQAQFIGGGGNNGVEYYSSSESSDHAVSWVLRQVPPLRTASRPMASFDASGWAGRAASRPRSTRAEVRVSESMSTA